jgi:hypothetical protein
MSQPSWQILTERLEIVEGELNTDHDTPRSSLWHFPLTWSDVKWLFPILLISFTHCMSLLSLARVSFFPLLFSIQVIRGTLKSLISSLFEVSTQNTGFCIIYCYFHPHQFPSLVLQKWLVWISRLHMLLLSEAISDHQGLFCSWGQQMDSDQG